MVMARSALFLIILLLINCSVAVRKPWISQKEQELRLSSHAVYFNAYGANHHAPIYIKYYSHLAGAQVVTYDAHLSWRVDKEGVKLLRLEIWPGGSDPAVRMTMQEAINLLRRTPG